MITRPVWKLDKQTSRLIQFYECVADAARALGRLEGQDIYTCCKNKKPSAYGYKWRYATEIEINQRNKNNELFHSRRKPCGE